jgi:anti-anti-sigma factor
MLRSQQTEAGLLIAVEGRIDSTTAEGFKDAVLSEVREEGQIVVLDLAAVVFVSSAGLRVLLQIAKSMNQGIRLCCLRPEVMGVFSMSGFDRLLSVFESQEDAFAGMGS